MPTDTLKSLASKANVSIDKAEKLWKKAKGLAKEQGLDPESDRYWAYVVGIVKKMLKIESLDMVSVGYNPKVLSEAVISKSSASFMKSRMRKVTDELSKLGDEGQDASWKSIALNLRLFFNEYLSSLSSRTGLKALLLGESQYKSVPSIKSRLREAKSFEEMVDIYEDCFPNMDEGELRSVLGA